MIEQVPIDAIANQQFKVVLNKQNFTIKLYVRGTSLYMDVYVDDVLIQAGAIVYDRSLIIQYNLELLKGNFALVGNSMINPNNAINVADLGINYNLFYIDGDDLTTYEANYV